MTPALIPPGASEPFVAPAPVRCLLCGGEPVDCERCRGSGWEFARFDLLPSRTYGLRRVRYEPQSDGTGRLFVGLAKSKRHTIRWQEYTIAETENGWGGRSFACAKVGTGRVHNCFLGSSVSCECEAFTYVSAARANQRAFDIGEETFPTFGCFHSDGLHALLLGGWFDLQGGNHATGSRS